MNRTLVNMLVDIAAGVLFLAMILTGFLLRFPLPPGTNQSLALWGLTRHQWGSVHFWISLAFLATLVLHVALHWQWVVSVVGKRILRSGNPKPGMIKPAVVTVLALAGLLGGFAWLTYAGRYEIQSPHAAPTPGDVRRLLQDNCLGCHGGDRPAAGFHAERREDYFRADSPLVVPGDGAASPLIEIVSGRLPDMRQAAVHKLTDAQVEQLREWINAGAQWPE